ncbi:MAG: glycosyltransferase family 2 protein [Cyclobacteriaceae bacterium]
MSKVAVVILNFNGRDYLNRFLPSLITHTPDAELIVADNASTDDSLELLKTEFPTIRRIEMSENSGFAGGYNVALKEVKADYFVLLNSDVEVVKGWLAPMVDFLDSNSSYAVCQPKILDFNKQDHFEYAGASGGFLDMFGFPFCRGRVFNKIEADQGQYDSAIDISWASGACMMVRANTFFNANGFDVDFFAHMEEIDLCWRIQRAGSRIKCIPNSTVYHVGGGTLSKSSPLKTYLNFRNGLNLLVKNMPLRSLVWKFPVRVLLDWVAALKFLFEGGTLHALAVIRAHGKVALGLFGTLRKRSKPSRDITKDYSIVVRHFLRKQNRYSNL